jgi:hypothetical protein
VEYGRNGIYDNRKECDDKRCMYEDRKQGRYIKQWLNQSLASLPRILGDHEFSYSLKAEKTLAD